MQNILMDRACLTQVFLAYAPIEALQVKINIESALEACSLPSSELLAQMKEQGIELPDERANVKAIDIGAINPTVLHKHLTELFLNYQTLLKTISEFSLKEKIALRDFLLELVPLLHLPSEQLITKMREEGLLTTLFGEQDKVLAVKQKIAAIDIKDNKVDKVKQRLAALSDPKVSSKDELKIARVKAKLSKATTESTKDNSALVKTRLAQLG